MEFVKIWILDGSNKELGGSSTPVLFNVDHIVSIKPIRIIQENMNVEGYWLRTSNNKKYRCVKLPDDLMAQFEEDLTSSKMIDQIDANNEAYLDQSHKQ